MPPEVVQAMAEAAGWFVSIPELQEKVGARIAGLLGVPAAMVTAGAASAIAVGTAACMTWDNLPAIDRLPETVGLRNEVILQKGHKSRYEPQMSLTGAKVVWVETREELDRAINPRTAMMFFLNRFGPLGAIKREEWLKVGKERGVLTFLDAAADVPPISRFSEYIREGFDLVTFSGGKAIRGPQASGLSARPPRPDRGGSARHQPQHGDRSRHEGRQGGDRRVAGRRRALPQARPRRGMANLGGPIVGDHRQLAQVPGMSAGKRSPRSPITSPRSWSSGANGILRSRPRRSSASSGTAIRGSPSWPKASTD